MAEIFSKKGKRSNLTMIIAIDSTLRGPALGGLRMMPYSSAKEASKDATRLAQGMTIKAAAAQLELGGGKGVIITPENMSADLKEDALLDFGDLVQSLQGRYITAEDIGVSSQDLLIVAQQTHFVAGLPISAGGSGDPSPFTALGVKCAAEAGFEFLGQKMQGECLIIGAGHVGLALNDLLKSEMRVTVTDIDPSKQELSDAHWVDIDDMCYDQYDLIAPCAVADFVNPKSVQRIKARLICGSANNQLADNTLLSSLDALYLPDFIVNAGGLINIYQEIKGFNQAQALDLVLNIKETTKEILALSQEEAITTLEAAQRWSLANAA